MHRLSGPIKITFEDDLPLVCRKEKVENLDITQKFWEPCAKIV